MAELKEILKQRLLPLIQEENLELVELEFVGRPPHSILRLFVDKIGGVNINECTCLSQKLSEYLDTEDLIENRYTLEVSSPGLERPLLSRDDFKRKTGERVRIYTKTSTDNQMEIKGKITDVGEVGVRLKVENKEEIIPWEKIEKGKIII